MIPHAVEQAIGIGGDARCGQSYERTERRGLTLERKLVDQPLIHVGVKGGIVLDQVAPTFDGDNLSGRPHIQGDVQIHGNHRAHLYVLNVTSKTGGGEGHVIRVERNVGNAEPSIAIGSCGILEAANGVFHLDRRAGYHGSRGIGDDPSHRCGIAAGLRRVGCFC